MGYHILLGSTRIGEEAASGPVVFTRGVSRVYAVGIEENVTFVIRKSIAENMQMEKRRGSKDD
jgi:hypothetical protein